MNNARATNLLHSRWLLLVFAGILIALSYGSVTTRGGYADDFAFLAYSSTHSYFDAVLNWSNTFNSRISQGVMMPLFLKSLASDTPGSINWTVFHTIGLAAFALSVFLLYKIMRLFNLPWQASIAALLVFSLNPIKNEALLWPATIVGYIIPLCIFLFATLLLFRNAKNTRETLTGLTVTGLLYLFCLFAIEQLFPLFILVIVMRFIFFSYTRQQLAIAFTSTLLLSAVYLLVTFSGKTTERMDPFINVETSSITSHIVDVLKNSLTDLLGYTPRILLDPYFHTDLLEAGQSAAFILAILTLTVFSVVLSRHPGTARGPDEKTNKHLLLLFSAGMLIYLATMSPFMILSYYIAARALYIPSLGISLMAGAVFAYLSLMARQQWLKNLLAGSLALLLALFVLVNIFSEKDFARQWALEKDIIHHVASVRDYIPDNTELSVFNVPKSYGPSPGFINRFGFNGMVNWIIPGQNLYGETQNDFSDVFKVPGNIRQHDQLTIQPVQGAWALAWTPRGVIRIEVLKLYNVADSGTVTTGSTNTGQTRHTTAPGELYGTVSQPGLSASYSNTRSVTVNTVIYIPQIDVGLVQVLLPGPETDDTKLRLVLHAQHRDGLVQPYDTTVSPRNGFHHGADGYNKYFFVSEFSSIKMLRVSLTSKNENLSLRNRQDPAGLHTASGNETPRVLFF